MYDVSTVHYFTEEVVMDIGTTTQVSAAQYRTTTAVGDRDVGQKGSFYRRQRQNNKHLPEEKRSSKQSNDERTQHTIDIRV